MAPSSKAYLVLICVASTVVFLAGAFSCGNERGWTARHEGYRASWGDEGCDGHTAWALCAGLISMLLALLMLIGEAVGSLQGCKSKAAPFVAVFFFVWWMCAAGAITFAGPYTVVSNGYLGSWIAFFGSVLYGLEVSAAIQKGVALLSGSMEKAGPPMAGLIIASIVELIAASVYCSDCTDYRAYAVAVGTVSLALCFIVTILPKCIESLSKFVPYVILLTFLWWLVAAIVLTFVSPFVWAGNGFFSTWVAVVSAALVYKNSDAPGAAQVTKASSAV